MPRCLLVLVAIVLASNACARAPSPISLSHAEGYGAAATGGSLPCHFRDEMGLRDCLGRGGALVVPDVALTVDPGRRRLEVAPNTTLDGEGKLTIAPSLYGLAIHVANVIVRNTTFRGPGPAATLIPDLHPGSNCTTPVLPKEVFGCAEPIYMTGAARDIWIDHNSFSECGDKCIEGWDKGDGTGRPDMITFSHNIFRNSYFAITFGVTKRSEVLPTPGHVTFYGNLFDHIFKRSPRAAGGYQMHVFNNYFVDWGGQTYRGAPEAGCNEGFGASVTGTGEMLLEANVAEAGPCQEFVNNVPYVTKGRGYDRPAGKMRSVGNLGLRGARISGNDVLDFAPRYPYTRLPVDQVKAAVLRDAGPPRAR